MDFDLGNAWDSIKDGTKEITEVAHAKTSEFHDKYVSKVLPDCGKYGDAVKFVAEMAPGVEEYNAIVEGDWTAFAIAAGIDIAALAAGAVTAGAGYTAIKGATSVAKTGVKVAVKEIAESGAKKAVKKVVKESTEKAIKEVAEEGTEKIVKEVAEQTAEKVTKEVVETGVEKTAKEVVETGVEKATKETVEAGTEKAAKETAEAGAEKTGKELINKSEKLDKKVSQIEKNKLDGIAREEKVLEELTSKYGKNNVIREALIRNVDGIPIKDLVTNEARRIDFVVQKGNKVMKSIEVTSETASKTLQTAKELRILERAREMGGAYIKNPYTGELIRFSDNVVTEIRRLS